MKRSMNKDHLPERIPVHGGYSGRGGSGGGAMRGGGGHEDMRVQFEELKDMNRMYRTQMQVRGHGLFGEGCGLFGEGCGLVEGLMSLTWVLTDLFTRQNFLLNTTEILNLKFLCY